jgi:O-antigen ligase
MSIRQSIHTRDQSKPPLVEKLFAVSALILLQGGFLGLLGTSDANYPDAGVPFIQGIWALIYLTALLLLVMRCNKAPRDLLGFSWIGALLLLAILSATWSDAPAITVRRSIAITGTSLFGVYVAVRYEIKSQLYLLAGSFVAVATCSIIFAAFGSGACPVLSTHDTGWCGIFSQKNRLGEAMALAVLVFLMLAKMPGARKLHLWVGAACALVLLFISDSKTFLLACLACVPLLSSGSVIKKGGNKLVKFAICALLLFAAIAYSIVRNSSRLPEIAGEITSNLGRDISLSGRLELWVLSAAMALRRPWFGYGYNGFWLGYAGPSLAIWRVLTWKPFYAHNGVLELWLDLGLIGVALFVVGYITALKNAVHHLRTSASPAAIWPLLVFVFLAFTNLTESSLLGTNDIAWMLYVAAIVTVSPRRAAAGRE